MAENNDHVTGEKSSPWSIPDASSVFAAPRRVLIEPTTPGYRILVLLGNLFTLASLIAWFVLLISLIFLVFSLMNSLETLNVMREQGVLLYNEYGGPGNK